MSYILDALRRADAERERGAVPGIHAQPVPAIASESGTNARGVPWRWVVASAGIALMIPLAWQLMTRETSVAQTPLPAAPLPAAPAAMPQTANTQTAAPPVA